MNETWWGCVGNGVLVLPPADPNSWYIKDGKLYFLLFYGLWDWLETEPGGLDQSLAIASGRWRQCFGDIFETNFMFDGVISDLYQGTCEMRDGSAPSRRATTPGAAILRHGALTPFSLVGRVGGRPCGERGDVRKMY